MTGKVLGLAVLAASVLPAAKITTDYDRSKDFRSYRTFALAPSSQGGRTSAFGDPLMRRRVEQAAAVELQRKGLREVPYGTRPDLIVRCWTGERERREVAPPAFGPYGWGPRYPARVYRYDEQTIVVDLVEARTRELAWRATVREERPKPKDADRKIAGWIEKAFRKYPR